MAATDDQDTQGKDAKNDWLIRGSLDVVNPGILSTIPSVVRFYLSTDDALDPDDMLVDEVSVAALPAGKSVEIKLRARYQVIGIPWART